MTCSRCGEETKGIAPHHARIEDCLDFLRLSVTQLNLYVARAEIEAQAARRRAETLLAILQEIADLARPQIMIGSKNECLGTIERYRAAGVTHFIFMTFSPYFEDEIQGFAEEVIPAVRGA